MKKKAKLKRDLGIEVKVETGPSQSYYLSGEVLTGWVIQRPMQVRIQRDEAGDYISTNDDLSVYGVGKDWGDAIKNYIESLIEYYELIEREARDHEPTAYYLRRIQHYITRV